MRQALIFLVIVLHLLVSGCSREPLFQSQSYVFGTLVDITIEGEPESRARALANHVMQHFQGLHNRLHAWQPSELSTLNQAFAQGKTLEISAELAQIISDATLLSVKSSGLFNPTIGGLINAWGFQRSEFTPVQPDAQKIADLVKANPQMTDIVVKKEVKNGDNHYTAYSKNRAVQLDLGGYAKGYALDNAAQYLRSQGVKNALINIGGNIIAIGQHGDKPWRVGIQDPRGPSALASINLADGWAIGTSGDYQRYFELNGKRYCHIIDPRLGYPAQGLEAVTIVVPPQANAGTLSDVLSKPIFIGSPLARSAFIKQFANEFKLDNIMLIDSQHALFVTDSLRRQLTWIDANNAKLVKTLH